MRIQVLLGVATLLLAATAQPRQILTNRGSPLVGGTISDTTGAPIPGASVQISGKDRKYSVRTLSDGKYSARVAPGTYDMRVTSLGFCEVHRGQFVVQEAANIQFDFELRVAAIADGVTNENGKTRYVSRIECLYTYKEEYLDAIPYGEFQPLVSYGRREQDGDLVKYSGPADSHDQLSVLYTYNLLAIKARTLTYSRKDNSIRGEGGVVWQDGKSTRIGSTIELTFISGEPRVAITN